MVMGATGTPAGVVVANVSLTGSAKGLVSWSAAPAGGTAFPGERVNGREKKKKKRQGKADQRETRLNEMRLSGKMGRGYPVRQTRPAACVGWERENLGGRGARRQLVIKWVGCDTHDKQFNQEIIAKKEVAKLMFSRSERDAYGDDV